MRIENLTKLIEGELLNSPSVTYIDQIRINPKSVKRGDAFLTTDATDIDIAIQNGAYAIIHTEEVTITDKEIAWIRVEDIQKSIIRYLRFKIVQSGFDIYYVNDIVFQTIKTTISAKNIIFLDDDIMKNFLKVINADIDTTFISNRLSFVKEIDPSFKKIEKSDKNFIKPIKSSLFQMDFICDGIYHKEIKIPKIFINFLNDALKFLKERDFGYDISKIAIHSHFEPIFIDNMLNIKEYGETNRVLIIESDETMMEDEIRYLCQYAKYAKNCVLTKNGTNDKQECIDMVNYEKDFDISVLKRYNANFYLINEERDKILNELTSYQKKREKTLF